ncbi:MAG: dihydroorotate dehydrogenase electron transfer subunit [Candidatus Zixiibacteriota bacterium]|nr:MAG: dihydroorotate dehydrogenase electron transfer subunit [candidate division Zixibacteria bacterium]
MTKPVCADAFLIRQRNLKNDYYSYTFGPFPGVEQCRPGNFVHLRLPSSDVYFRRAMSVTSVDKKNRELEILFRVVGRGTSILARYQKNDPIGILGPLGNSFSKPRKKEIAAIVAGGVGFPPLAYFAEHLVNGGFDPKRILFFYGGKSASDIIERGRIKKMGVRFHPMTDDGSFGRKGLITQGVEEFLRDGGNQRVRMYACGPEAMLRAVDDLGLKYRVPGELSLEAPMPCGIGVCLGCIVTLRKGGYARVCHEGPVFKIGEVLL